MSSTHKLCQSHIKYKKTSIINAVFFRIWVKGGFVCIVHAFLVAQTRSSLLSNLFLITKAFVIAKHMFQTFNRKKTYFLFHWYGISYRQEFRLMFSVWHIWIMMLISITLTLKLLFKICSPLITIILEITIVNNIYRPIFTNLRLIKKKYDSSNVGFFCFSFFLSFNIYWHI